MGVCKCKNNDHFLGYYLLITSIASLSNRLHLFKEKDVGFCCIDLQHEFCYSFWLSNPYMYCCLKTTTEVRQLHKELNEKVSEIKRLQLELTRQKGEEASNAMDSSKRLIETLEKENTTLKVCRYMHYIIPSQYKMFLPSYQSKLENIFDVVL